VVDPGFYTGVDCEHPRFGLRRRVYRNGVTHWVYQCERCGAAGRSIKKDVALSQHDGATAPLFEDDLADRFWEERRRQRAEASAIERDAKRASYALYLNSPDWHERRRLRLELDRFVCQAQLAGCRQRATQVHHLDYRFVGNEPLFDLVSVCRPCHEAISRMEGRPMTDDAIDAA
jgi:hypothetical protein